MATESFYGLTANTLRGEPYNFADLKGKVVLVVNVASQCGFTPQYKGLQELYDKFKDRGFTILGFPCNQFGGQEPGEADQIQACPIRFGVSFPIMEKVEVNGNGASDVYKFLKSSKKQFGMELIKWNFEKFLIDREGNVVSRFSSMATPAHLEPEIEKLL
ncbi:hypothetical protein HYH03_005005 [Edaphochlamys debaryana]|uniref:Glutathione peroxidase n=1 Tax=Edaphochlamys debaryana TaxID=47281 RepID=A0A835YDV8_9CHLO|nr:hypothetical protein HYH03_005005 [Edaphochlamys debaryana]|eukprot:KAG2497000.1 hypothetical protein HYH03_005005 [Edaphochlamys debaryana]